MAKYIHERKSWPRFEWDGAALVDELAAVRHRQGRLQGRMEALGLPARDRAVLETLTEDVVRSSEIEGDLLDRAKVRSSVARRLNIDIGALAPVDRRVDGLVSMLLDATQHYAAPLTEERLFGWHAAMFPTGRSGMAPIVVGGWRTDSGGPMQVVSGPIGRERVHFEAPMARRIPKEMRAFLRAFNEKESSLDPVLKAAVAHLWFVTIHPFDDGNGRIARAIADLALARAEGSPQRFYSMSSQIQKDRKAFYDILEATQKGSLDITGWLRWFLVCLDRACRGAETVLGEVLEATVFWDSRARDAVAGQPLNERQRGILRRLLEGFEGKLTSSKWATLTKTSPDTALRDINDLVERGLLSRDEAGGRSTSYSLRRRPGT